MIDASPPLDSGTPGVYYAAGDPVAVAAALEDVGWSTAVVAPAATTHEFYDGVVAALSLPAYFGRNLDALWDCLTDLDTPTAVILSDWQRFAAARPGRWSAILDLFVERTEASPAFAVVLAS